MAKRPTKNDIRQVASSTVSLFSAVLNIADDARVVKGKFKHLDPELSETPGWWVDCRVFVPAYVFQDEKDS